MIVPLEAHGVKVISMGFFVAEEKPVIWRGPMLHKAVQQFLGDVYWGELDFLLLDLPPGTGDVSLSMAQFLPGAQMLVVTTPQEAARKVAERAGKMAGQVRQRCVGVIENMSYFVCPHCGERTAIFGEGGGQEAADTLGVPLLGQIPLMPELREGGDEGTPIVVSDPDSAAGEALLDAAGELATVSRTRRPQAAHPDDGAGPGGGNGHAGGNGTRGTTTRARARARPRALNRAVRRGRAARLRAARSDPPRGSPSSGSDGSGLAPARPPSIRQYTSSPVHRAIAARQVHWLPVSP